MSNWTIEPNDGVRNLGNGKFSFPENTTDNDKVYTIIYTDDNGCTGTTSYTVSYCDECIAKLQEIECGTERGTYDITISTNGKCSSNDNVTFEFIDNQGGGHTTTNVSFTDGQTQATIKNMEPPQGNADEYVIYVNENKTDFDQIRLEDCSQGNTNGEYCASFFSYEQEQSIGGLEQSDLHTSCNVGVSEIRYLGEPIEPTKLSINVAIYSLNTNCTRQLRTNITVNAKQYSTSYTREKDLGCNGEACEIISVTFTHNGQEITIQGGGYDTNCV